MLLQMHALTAYCKHTGMRDEWRLLYSSEHDGQSFNTLMGRSCESPGPTLLLIKWVLLETVTLAASVCLCQFCDGCVAPSLQSSPLFSFPFFVELQIHSTSHSLNLLNHRDAQGSVMGGFGPEPWHKNGNFFGGHSAFVFSLAPAFFVYNATGYNEVRRRPSILLSS